jgi:hypothetical protein
MNTQLPAPIQPLLSEYQALLARDVPELVEACYLHGSIALGAFNADRSDIDFLALLRRPPTDEEIAALGAIHHALAAKYPRWPLEGSYLQWHDLGQLPEAVAPYPHVEQGTFHASGHYDLNLVTWWVLKQHGIGLIGPAAQTLPFEVDLTELLARMHENLHSYWHSWTRQPSRMVRLLSDDGFQCAVLGVSRLWYTFREHAITSKTGAGRYALEHMPTRWHPLIREAIAVREHNYHASYVWHFFRAYAAVQFLKYVIAVCDELAD